MCVYHCLVAGFAFRTCMYACIYVQVNSLCLCTRHVQAMCVATCLSYVLRQARWNSGKSLSDSEGSDKPVITRKGAKAAKKLKSLPKEANVTDRLKANQLKNKFEDLPEWLQKELKKAGHITCQHVVSSSFGMMRRDPHNTCIASIFAPLCATFVV